MDNSPTGILAIIGVVISVGTALLGIINHQRIRSNCCGNKLEVSLDIEKTSPVERQKSLRINNPADKSEAPVENDL